MLEMLNLFSNLIEYCSVSKIAFNLNSTPASFNMGIFLFQHSLTIKYINRSCYLPPSKAYNTAWDVLPPEFKRVTKQCILQPLLSRRKQLNCGSGSRLHQVPSNSPRNLSTEWSLPASWSM